MREKSRRWLLVFGVGVPALGLSLWGLHSSRRAPERSSHAAHLGESGGSGVMAPEGGSRDVSEADAPPSQPVRSARMASLSASDADGARAAAARALARQRADALRKHARQRRDRHQAPSSMRPQIANRTEGDAAARHALSPREEERRRAYLNQAMHEQYFPVARSCHEDLLARDPTAEGKVVLSFAIVGAEDAGVIDRVETQDGTTIDDPDFTQCMRESLYTTVFQAPPAGAEETTVVYPVVLKPGP
ncbi:MAG TPA: AgmX/PglI C-terminal domain-containing protein [Polyangiaceae bacterium]|nr:AgmX/PglI C-terminal domain-containing protein [Polyangiaceae bacterium]